LHGLSLSSNGTSLHLDGFRNMTFGDASDVVLTFVRDHEIWGGPIVFVLAFGESLAFISLLLPGTAILFGVGGLIGATSIGFWTIWLAAALGAALGDWVSYWLDFHYKHAIGQIWPLSRHPGLLARGEAFFQKWGVLGIFLGRFFGPLRSAVPLAAGLCAMPMLPFQAANIASAFVWATGILTPGLLTVGWLL
jgi:membrane protein DedA with SNARE-associated domain